MQHKRVSYTASNSYTTLFKHTPKTKNLWFSFHGMGYLSKYFAQHFQDLCPEKNYIVVPQAPSKYYQGKDFKYVGASWLTKEDTQNEIVNVLNYTQQIAQTENIMSHQDKLIMLGYSQGVSIALRWIAAKQVSCKTIIIHSGGIPKELTSESFRHLNPNTKVYLLYGNQDEYLTPQIIEQQLTLATNLFGNKLEVVPFQGKHQVNTAFIKSLGS